jgi:uncharacterized protein with ParB-like and HNH nuclease domain
MVLDQIRTYGNQVPAHLIIDGQQRLTTFQILLSALREVAQNVGASAYADEVQRYLQNNGIMQDPDEERFKIWPTRVDQDAFKIIVMPASINEMESYEKKNSSMLIQAYNFFKDAILKYSMNDESLRRIETLYHVLREDLEVVSIELDGDDDPQVIFETLNARGEPLLPSDLLRNSLFWRASRKNEDKDVLYERYWLPFDQKFWKHEERLGRLKRPRIDIFMQHFLESQEGQEVNIGRLFQEYKTWINERTPFETVEAELESLTNHAAVFRQLIEANQESLPYGLFFWRLKQIDVSTVYPLLLYILTHPDASKQDVSGMLLDLESYLFRRLICGLTAKNYNRIFLQMVRELRTKGLCRENLQKSLLSMSGEAGVWPDNRMFGEIWINRHIYIELKPAQRIVVIMKAIEDALRKAKSEEITIHSALTVEHILPQNWEKTWPLTDGTYAKDRFSRIVEGLQNPEADQRDSLLHTFGNLTLLTHPLNSAVSNGRWEEKGPEICKQSALALNRTFQDYPNWNVEEIRNRSRWLFDIAKGIWSYPAV